MELSRVPPAMKRQLAGAVLWSLTGTFLGATPAIIPLPQQMQTRPGVFTLCPSRSMAGASAPASTRVLVDSSSQETGQFLAGALFRSTGCQLVVATNSGTVPVKGAVLLTTVNALPSLGAEGYELTVSPDSVVIRAPAPAGVFYGVQSLLQLFPPQILAPRPVRGVPWTAPCVYIQDQPRFAWRGWMLDVARHFFDKQEIKQALDAMALHKLNTFHWHLVDDQGWRIEILKYPRLTQVGAWRDGIDWSLNPRASAAYNAIGQYGGYYTQADIREIVAYAQQRHITIVPEIEMPGHSTAGVASYPQYSCNPSYPYSMDDINTDYAVYSPGTPGTFQFLEDILTEVIGLFPGQYVHTGGDEVFSDIWTTYPADKAKMQSLGINPASSTAVQQYQHWFSQQIANWLTAHGRTMSGWSEIEYGGVLTNATVMDWLDNEAAPAAQAGQNAVACSIDFAYLNNYEYQNSTWCLEPPPNGFWMPVSTVYGWDPIPSGLAPQYQSRILGAEGCLWCEGAPSFRNAEFQSYPRECAIAESTWTAKGMKNYADFAGRLAWHEQRLTQMGINYNSGSVPRIGSWAGPVSTTYATKSWDISTNVAAGGELDVSFFYTAGANGLDIQWAALLENGVELDRDTHVGFAGYSPVAAVYILRLPFRKTGAVYTIQASVRGEGGTDSNGNVYLPNWD
jgi:hexosaminidase